ncbi:MAG: EamA family transporter [Candidatus Polarisedimenticolia bacterium]
MKTFVVLAFAALSGAIAETLFSYGMRSFGEMDWSKPSRWLDMLLVVPRNPYVLIGVVFAAGFFFLYLTALSWADLSYAMPVTALSFVFAAVFARVFLGEHVSWHRWAGTVLVVAGIALVVVGGRQRTVAIEQNGQEAGPRR